MDHSITQPSSETNPLTKTAEQEITAYETLSTEERAKVDLIATDIDITDSSAVLQFGVQAQTNISNFSNSILKQVRSKDTGYIGEILTDMMVNVKTMEIDRLNSRNGLFGLFDGAKRKTQKFTARYEKINTSIDKTVTALDKSRMQLLKDITLLDKLYDNNLDYHRELEYYILAGEKTIRELQDKTLPELKSSAQVSGNPVDAQKVNDYNQLLTRFEKKVHDLKLSRMIALQTGPQVRLIQSNDQVLVEKIQSSILNTIPLWKNQVVIAISLFRQGKSLQQQKQVTETTNDLLLKNSELLKQNSVDIAKESEIGIVEIETLKKVNQDLIETIEETLQIQKEGRTKRAMAEEELLLMEQELKNKLIADRD